MKRKDTLKKELEERQKELTEILKAEEERRNEATEKIDSILGEDLFCGALLNMEDILTILKLYMTKNEPVKVRYNLYNIEE